MTRPSAVPVRLEPREDLDLSQDVVPDVLVADVLLELGPDSIDKIQLKIA